jgi:hypothetical protein
MFRINQNADQFRCKDFVVIILNFSQTLRSYRLFWFFLNFSSSGVKQTTELKATSVCFILIWTIGGVLI